MRHSINHAAIQRQHPADNSTPSIQRKRRRRRRLPMDLQTRPRCARADCLSLLQSNLQSPNPLWTQPQYLEFQTPRNWIRNRHYKIRRRICAATTKPSLAESKGLRDGLQNAIDVRACILDSYSSAFVVDSPHHQYQLTELAHSPIPNRAGSGSRIACNRAGNLAANQAV